MINNATHIRRELLTRMIQLFNNMDYREFDRIPIEMRPKKMASTRCCIYKDRAVLKYKLMGMLGYNSDDEEDELVPVSEYLSIAIESGDCNKRLLSVIDEACSSCQTGNYVVTNMCRGCVGRPCEVNCPKNAVQVINGQAIINQENCVKCGICEKACPYHSIIYTPIPCEESCPVDAIKKDELGRERIDEDKCIKCGKCMQACPWGAIVEKSHLFYILKAIKHSEDLTAMVAPAIAAQFNMDFQSIVQLLKTLGFKNVLEVAEGADITIQNEGKEWLHKMNDGASFMTTSCCPSYTFLVDKHIPELKPYVSDTRSPMVYTAEIAKERFPNAKTVFIGPCLAKKKEAQQTPFVDYVINFEELYCWMETMANTLKEQTNTNHTSISQEARGFCVSGGVTNAVAAMVGNEPELRPYIINGITKKETKQLKAFANRPPQENFIEVMSCENGCIGGCHVVEKPAISKKRVGEYIKTGNPLRQTIEADAQ